MGTGRIFVAYKPFYVLFADDTNIFDINKDIKSLIHNVNIEHFKIIDWLNTNKLYLDINNIHYILFRNKDKIVINN